MNCRSCSTPIAKPFLSLGMSPFSNAFLSEEHLGKMEAFFPLETFVCPQCYLVQLDAFEAPEKIFSDYVYFSSYSSSWLKHAEKYAEQMVARKKLNEKSLVVEIASNDGYLLQYFAQKGIPVLGVEPAANVAEVAIQERNVRTISEFFGEKLGRKLAQDGFQADVMAANNVLAHVPDLNDFVRGFKQVLKRDGIATFEFPHLKKLIEENQFDTIYHEHFSYFSLLAVAPVFARAGLEVFDLDELTTHGGSLRLFIKHKENTDFPVTVKVSQMIELEKQLGYGKLEFYENYRNQVMNVKRELLSFLIEAKRQGKKIVGYGAAAKGNTLLNYCGIREDFLDYVCDKNPHKQGKYLPGVHIPVKSPDEIMRTKPDYILILPWNLKSEIQSELSQIRSWGGKFLVGIPKLEVF